MRSEEKKIFLISLGCAKNRVDSENMLGQLKEKGFSISTGIEDARTVIINTCGFIQPAVEECIDTILEAVELKKAGDLDRIIVTGCFVQRYGYKLKREMPEVDGWLGTGEIHRIAALLEGAGDGVPFFLGRPEFLADHNTPRVLTTPYYSAYLKIAEGCSHRCSFCSIPMIRGDLRSRGLESLLIEAEALAGNGVKEINLVAQDSTMYGKDLSCGHGIEELLTGLLKVDGIEWIRLLYSHPMGITEGLLDLIDGNERLCPYLDIPLQHVNREILERMGRGYYGETPMQLIKRIRSRARRIGIRTSLMVGFPGETESAFRELYDFTGEAEFDHMGVFIYSPETGTGAGRLAGIPDPKVSGERLDAVMTLQKGISERKNQAMVDQTVSVLIEGVSPETELLLTGRTARMAPEVDGQVLINEGQGIVGEIMQVRITEAHPYDLVGEII